MRRADIGKKGRPLLLGRFGRGGSPAVNLVAVLLESIWND
jgi:hypothetical protein